MGSGNSSDSKNTTKSVPGNRNYQRPAGSFANYTYPASTEKNDKRNYDSQTQLNSKVPREPAENDDYHQQRSKQSTSTVPVEKPLSPDVLKQQISSASHNTSNNISSPHTVTSSSFEKAPMIQLNYVVKSSDNKSMHTYGPDNVTIMHRTTSQSVPNGNRWYDKDYNKNISPLVVKDH